MVRGGPQICLRHSGVADRYPAAQDLHALRGEERVDALVGVRGRRGVLRAPGATAQPSRSSVARRLKVRPFGRSLRSPPATACGAPRAARRSRSMPPCSRRSSFWRERWQLSTPRRAAPPKRTTAVAKPRLCSPGVSGSSTSSVRSTVARREQRSAGPEAVPPPERITWPDAAARRASFLRHRKKRGLPGPGRGPVRRRRSLGRVRRCRRAWSGCCS